MSDVHRPVHVSGGSGSVAVNLFELIALVATFGRARGELGEAYDDLRFTLDGPMAAGYGPLPDLGLADRLRMIDVRIVTDAALADLWLASWRCGLIHAGVTHAIEVYVLGEDTLLAHAKRLARSVVIGQVTLLATGDPGRAVVGTLTDDPDDYYRLLHLGPPGLAQEILQDIMIDGDGIAIPTGVDTAGVAGRPPRDLDDLIGDLAQRNEDHRHGEIDVRILTMPDGSRKVVVDITGTKTWGLRDTDPTDLRTNLVAMNGRETAYERGVLDAMRQAGVTADDDVMLVGHSQGGMIAVNAAARLARTGEFRVTHVVTAGAPIGRGVRAVPGRTQVLAIEDRSDAIPVLDDRANPDRRNVTTAVTDRGDGTFGGDHDLRRTYLPGAADVEASRQRSLRHFLGGMRAYFGARSVTTHTYQVRRT